MENTEERDAQPTDPIREALQAPALPDAMPPPEVAAEAVPELPLAEPDPSPAESLAVDVLAESLAQPELPEASPPPEVAAPVFPELAQETAQPVPGVERIVEAEAPVLVEVRHIQPEVVAEAVLEDVEPVQPEPPKTPPIETLQQAVQVMENLRARMKASVLGRDEVIDLILVALLSDGHVLLEDFPGSGKTTLAKALGNSILDDRPDDYVADFRRIQFTPDLLPSDVTGVSVFDAASGRFHFRHGPIFAHVVLADEINRTSPKVQSAMLEAMAEKQVTVDNITFRLDDLFFVIATQNPLDLAGTYPLPSAQLDRFLFKIRMEHIDRDSELQVLKTYRQRRDVVREDLPRVTRTQVFQARGVIDQKVQISPEVKECLVDIARATRTDDRILQGASTRSLVLMLPALQARAALKGRDFVSSEDIETLVPRVFGHRVDLAPGVTNLMEVLLELSASPLEKLARSTMRRRS